MNKKHLKNKKTLKTFGFVLLGIGLIFLIIGFVSFFGAMNGGGTPENFWCLFVAFPLITFGGQSLILGYKSEMNRYVKNESTPIVKEMYQDMKPEINDFVNIVNNSEIECPKCKTINNLNDNFCKKCRYEFIKECSHCKAKIAGDSLFCSKCGRDLNK